MEHKNLHLTDQLWENLNMLLLVGQKYLLQSTAYVKFLAQPLEEHWKAVKRTLRYLKGSISHGLLLQKGCVTSPMTLTAYCDAD